MTTMISERDGEIRERQASSVALRICEEARRWKVVQLSGGPGGPELKVGIRQVWFRQGTVGMLVFVRDRFRDSEPCGYFEDDQARVKILRWLVQGL